jgi:hypothetical protein
MRLQKDRANRHSHKIRILNPSKFLDPVPISKFGATLLFLRSTPCSAPWPESRTLASTLGSSFSSLRVHEFFDNSPLGVPFSVRVFRPFEVIACRERLGYRVFELQ